MTMQEFVTATNKAAEIYKGEIIAMNNDLDGNLHVLLSQKNFDSIDIKITAVRKCEHPDCRGDYEVEKRLGNIVFTFYHRGAYNRQEVA